MSSILDNKLNKDKCQKFTPTDVVEDMLDIADYKKGLAGKKVLENSFGSGNIIIAIVKRYIEDSLSAGISPEVISCGLRNDIYGVELDKDLIYPVPKLTILHSLRSKNNYWRHRYGFL